MSSSVSAGAGALMAHGVSLSLDAVYREHCSFVWRTVRRLGFDAAAAEDVTQEVFLVARRRLADYDGRSSVRVWLYGIARRVAANDRRGRRRAAARVEKLPPPDPAITPEQQLERIRAMETVRAFVEELSPEQAAVFELCELEGLSGPEAAKALEIPIQRVYSRIRATRTRFESFLTKLKESSAEGRI